MSGLLAASKFRWIAATQASTAAQFFRSPKTLENRNNEQRRHQTTTFVYNPSANIRNIRVRDPRIVDMMTPHSIRPRLPESIVPVECRYPPNAPPWPYKEKGYRWYHHYIDRTTKRFDENTKLICVEGNIGSGTHKFAKDLAEVLGFYFIPAPTTDIITTNGYGQDMRQFYHLFPERFQYFDREMFYKMPHKSQNVILMSFIWSALKQEAYANALAHILNTGQGVVLERSPYTDIAFIEAMYNKGLVSDAYADHYPQIRLIALNELKMYPHLFVYVDVPVSQCLENIKKYKAPYKSNGKVIDYEYLGDIEKHTKEVLKDLQKESEVLMFDWSSPGDIDRVAEDIYKIDFSYDLNASDRFTCWNVLGFEFLWNELRERMTLKWHPIREYRSVHWEIQELCPSYDEIAQMRYVLDNVVGNYVRGFNVNRGDKVWDMMFSKNSGYYHSNDKWVEYMIRDDLWAMTYQSIFYLSGPFEPNLTEEHFAPRKFKVEDLEHAHH